MIRAFILTHITRFMRWPQLLMAALCAACLGEAVYRPENREIVLPSGPPRLVSYADAPTNPEVRAAFDDEFLAYDQFYAAFAIGDDDTWGWVRNYGNRTTAQVHALAFCGGVEKSCHVIAEMLPVNSDADTVEVLRPEDVIHFDNYTYWIGPKALARSGSGILYWYGGWTAWGARHQALEACQFMRSTGSTVNLPPAPCRIIHSSWF